MKVDLYTQFQAFSFCGPSPKFVMKFNIHTLCDNGKVYSQCCYRWTDKSQTLSFTPGCHDIKSETF